MAAACPPRSLPAKSQPGVYAITSQAGGQRVGHLREVNVQAAVEAGDVVLRVAPGALLRVVNAQKTGYVQYQVVVDGVIVAWDGLAAGDRAEVSVPAGHVVVEYLGGQTTETKEVDLAVGQEQEVVFGEDG